MPVTTTNLNQIRRKARKTDDNYTLNEIVDIWNYLENVENDAALEGKTAREKENYIASTKNNFKGMPLSRLNDITSADLSGLSAYELDSLKRFLNYMSSSDLNDALLPRIEAQEKIIADMTSSDDNAVSSDDNTEGGYQDGFEADASTLDGTTADVANDAVNADAPLSQEAENTESENTEGETIIVYPAEYYANNNLNDMPINENPENESSENRQEPENTELDEVISDDYNLNRTFGRPQDEAQIISDNLDEIEKFPSTEDLLARDEATKEAVNPEFQSILDVIDHLEITDDGKPVSKEEKDSAVNLFWRQIRNETEMAMANDYTLPNQAAFKEEFANRAQIGLAQLVLNQTVVDKGDKALAAGKIDELAASFSGESDKKITVSKDTFAGWHAGKQIIAERAVNMLNKILGESGKQVIDRYSQKVIGLDKDLTKRYGKKYAFGKNIAKAAAWGITYGAAGAAFGPIGISAVAAVSTYKQWAALRKDYKSWKEKGEAQNRATGQYNKFSIDKYFFQNKAAVGMRVGGMLLSATTAVTGLTGNNIQSTKAILGLGLGGGNILRQTSEAYKAAPKGKKLWSAAKAFGTSTGAFFAGYWAGSQAGSLAHDAFTSNTPDIPASDNIQTPVADMPAHEAPVNEIPVEPTTPTVEPEVDVNAPTEPQVQPEQQADINTGDNENVQPEPETQVDVHNLPQEQINSMKMLFLRDPAEANQILGLEGKDWMNSRQLMEAWVNGDISDAQKAQLIDFSSQRFDENGNFRDVEGFTSAADMEAEAQRWSAVRSTASHVEPLSEQNTQAVEPETKVSEPAEAVNDNASETTQPAADIKYSDITVLDNGDTVFAAQLNNGAPIHVTMGPDGVAKEVIVDAHGKYTQPYECSGNEVENFNNEDAFKALREDMQSQLSSLQNTASETQSPVVEETKTAEQTPVEPAQASIALPEASDKAIQDIQIDNKTKNISFTYNRENGTTVDMTINKDGDVKAFSYTRDGVEHKLPYQQLRDMNRQFNDPLNEGKVTALYNDLAARLNGQEQNTSNMLNHNNVKSINGQSTNTTILAMNSNRGR